jgi:hypothetical protein
MKFIFRNNLFIIIFSIITILETPYAKASFAAEPHGDEHLHKYAQNSAFDASLFLESDFGSCSASRIRISENDPIDFYITAAHCIEAEKRMLLSILQAEDAQLAVQQKGIDYIIHPKRDLAIFTDNKPSNQLKYVPYTGSLDDLVGKTVTQVAFGSSL